MGPDDTAPYSSQPLTGVAPGVPTEKAGARMQVREALEHMIAVTYGVTYDAVVTRFPAYEAMVEEVVGFVGRSVPAEATPRSIRVLDVACGIGNVSIRLAREGYAVVGIDGVRHLVEIAREKTAQRRANLTFQHFDIARDLLPGAGTFDVLVSMHTLYWHPQPAALLEGCRRALPTCGPCAGSCPRRSSSSSATASIAISAPPSSTTRSAMPGSRCSRRATRSCRTSVTSRGAERDDRAANDKECDVMTRRAGSLLVLLATLVSTCGTSEAGHPGGATPKDVVLYELMEQAVFTEDGFRNATSALEGKAQRGTPLCPDGLQAFAKIVFATVGINVRVDSRCTVVAIGQSQIRLTDFGGRISGEFWVVVNSDATNLAD